jgi:hypothetical protein
VPRVRVRNMAGGDGLKRFQEMVNRSPARHEGWIDPEGSTVYQVSTGFLAPFRALAESFGLTVDAAPADGATEEMEAGWADAPGGPTP